ncbi:hypothetical protein D9M71_386870 [compost metagenome]
MLQRVDRIAHQHSFTGTTGGTGEGQLDLVIGVRGGERFGQVVIGGIVDLCDAGRGQAGDTGGIDVPVVVLALDIDALIAQQVVPDRLGTCLGDREWNAWQRVFDGIAAFGGARRGGIFHRVVQHAFRQCGCAVGRENLDPKARVTLGQLGGHCGQLALVLIHVLAVDHQQWLFRSERIGAQFVTRLEAGRRGGQAPLVRRDGTVGITGFLGADLGQLVPQFRSFGGIDGGVGRPGKGHSQGSGQGGGHQGIGEFHLIVLLLSRGWVNQKVVFRVR